MNITSKIKDSGNANPDDLDEQHPPTNLEQVATREAAHAVMLNRMLVHSRVKIERIDGTNLVQGSCTPVHRLTERAEGMIGDVYRSQSETEEEEMELSSLPLVRISSSDLRLAVLGGRVAEMVWGARSVSPAPEQLLESDNVSRAIRSFVSAPVFENCEIAAALEVLGEEWHAVQEIAGHLVTDFERSNSDAELSEWKLDAYFNGSFYDR